MKDKGSVNEYHFGCKLSASAANPRKLFCLSFLDKHRRFREFSLESADFRFQKRIHRQTLRQILIIIVSLVTLSGCNWKNMENTQKVTINNKKYTLEVAQTEEDRKKGLGGRETLDAGSGMIFLYDQADYLQFWMKDTLVPLQIIFVNKCEIVDFQEMTVEKDPANPKIIYKSKAKADKAIELNIKSVAENIVGQRIEQLCN